MPRPVFNVNSLPYVRTAALPKYHWLKDKKPVVRVRGFVSYDFKALYKQILIDTQRPYAPLKSTVKIENIRTESMLARVAKGLKISMDDAVNMGFSETELNLAQLSEALAGEALHKLTISLRRTDPKPEGDRTEYMNAVRMAIISRYCKPEVVLEPFDLQVSFWRKGLCDEEHAILAITFMKSDMGIKKPEDIDLIASSAWIVGASEHFTPETQFKEPEQYSERWFFFALAARSLFPDSQDQQTKFTESALAKLSVSVPHAFSPSRASIWLQNNVH